MREKNNDTKNITTTYIQGRFRPVSAEDFNGRDAYIIIGIDAIMAKAIIRCMILLETKSNTGKKRADTLWERTESA
jgi:hypothetical protein